jgi:hypothetical protein
MKKEIKSKSMLSIPALAILLLTAACNENLKTSSRKDAPVNNATVDIDEGYEQIERLARPAINEGLLITNSYLNAFNSIPPTFDLLTSNATVAAVLGEAGAVLTAVANLGIISDPANHVQRVVNGFLPDVMRIDLSAALPGSAYNGAAGLIHDPESDPGQDGPILCGGRKITDDVMDITLSYLAANDASGASVGDGVSYSPNHDPVLATFPFVPDPN